MKYLKKFNQASEYEAFKAGDEYVTPNVSNVVSTGVVHYGPYVEEPGIGTLSITSEADPNIEYDRFESILTRVYYFVFDESTQALDYCTYYGGHNTINGTINANIMSGKKLVYVVTNAHQITDIDKVTTLQQFLELRYNFALLDWDDDRFVMLGETTCVVKKDTTTNINVVVKPLWSKIKLNTITYNANTSVEILCAYLGN
jgi:hypothetical protein